MDFIKGFETVKKALISAKLPPYDGHFAIQVRISDPEAAGTFYFEASDGKLFVEPYDYYDNNADILIGIRDLTDIIKKKVTLDSCVENGKAAVSGDYEGLKAFFNAIPQKPAPKKTAKKTSDKKTATAPKKAAKTTTKAAPKKAAAEAVKEVPEKAVKESTKAAQKAAPAKKEAVKVEEKKKPEAPKETISEVVKKEVKPAKK